jgi:hypothetical protein
LAKRLDAVASRLEEVEPGFLLPEFASDEVEIAWLNWNHERLAELTLKHRAHPTGAEGAHQADFDSSAGAGSGAGQADRWRAQGELSERDQAGAAPWAGGGSMTSTSNDLLGCGTHLWLRFLALSRLIGRIDYQRNYGRGFERDDVSGPPFEISAITRILRMNVSGS